MSISPISFAGVSEFADDFQVILEPIDNALSVLTTLLEGWKECRSALLVKEAASHVQPELVGEAAQGRAWTL